MAKQERGPSGSEQIEGEWEKPEQCNVTELSLIDDLGGTRVQLGWESIKGGSNMFNSKLPQMLGKVFELMGKSKEEAAALSKEYIKHEEGDSEADVYGVEKIEIDLPELQKILGKDAVDSRDALGKVSKHFLLQAEK